MGNVYQTLAKKAKGTIETYTKAAQDLMSLGKDTKDFVDTNSPYGEKGTMKKTTDALRSRAKK